MQKESLNKLCCPMDKSELKIEIFKEEAGEVLEGLMTCPECRRYYPIIYSIPIMTPDDYRQKELEAPVLKRWGLETGTTDAERFLLIKERGSIKES